MPVFPVPQWNGDGYHHDSHGSFRYFGAPRGIGSDGYPRIHAGCDLYGPFGSPILAVADGVVRYAPYPFASPTYALEVIHEGYGHLVRYGEINQAHLVPGIREGVHVREGQVIGFMGQVYSRSGIPPMLHFEIYPLEAARGSLTGGGPYRRCKYLLDPTPFLDALRTGRAKAAPSPQPTHASHTAPAHHTPAHHASHAAPAHHGDPHGSHAPSHATHHAAPPEHHAPPPSGPHHSSTLGPMRMTFDVKG